MLRVFGTQTLRSIQIDSALHIGAYLLIAGLTFRVLTYFAGGPYLPAGLADRAPLWGALVAAGGAILFAAYVGIRRFIRGCVVKRLGGAANENTALLPPFALLTTAGLSLAELWGLIAIVGFAMTGVRLFLIVAAVALLALFALFPTRSCFARFAQPGDPLISR